MANLVAERSRTVQWLQKALDQMNVQIHRAVSDLTGVTGMAILRAIVAGERDPTVLARFRDKRCRKSLHEIARHLTGNWREEHLFNLTQALQLFDTIERMISDYESRIAHELAALCPPELADEPIPTHPNAQKEKHINARNEQQARLRLWRFSGVDLTRIDGISTRAAQTILTEVGLDLADFPTEKHFVSWLRLAPRMAISGGKKISTKNIRGSGANRISGVLRMSAVSMARSHTALGAYYRKIARAKGGKTAVFATARKLAVLVYRMLQHGEDYVDIGEQAYEARFAARRLSNLERTALELGYNLVPAAAAG